MSELFERSWPVQGAKAAVAIVHGLGEHSGRYEYVARKLNEARYSAYAMDVRGHGQSVGFPGDMGGDAKQIVNDVVEFCVRTRQSYEKVFLLAHSMGTLLSIPAVARVPNGSLAGLVLSGVATQPGPASVELVTNGAVPVESLSRDPAVQQAYTDDPLVWDKVPPEVFASTGDLGTLVQEAIPMIEIPVLMVHGVEDPLCSIQGANDLYAELVISDKRVIGYDGLRHEILNEPERDKVIGDVVAWLDEH